LMPRATGAFSFPKRIGFGRRPSCRRQIKMKPGWAGLLFTRY
jgi:hypothetical protein